MQVCSWVFVFFFSSRRRHTIWPRDWSSDVCSSDLRAVRSQHAVEDAQVGGNALRERTIGAGGEEDATTFAPLCLQVMKQLRVVRQSSGIEGRSTSHFEFE